MNRAITVNVLDIYLDTQNPRHEPIDSQPKIISHLLKTEKVKNLARDIADKGLSPIELFAVIQDHAGNFIAVEGNRRLCALTLLNDYEKHPGTDTERNYFKKLAEKSKNIPSRVNCVLFESREAADVWIERRHEGEQDGVGTKQWNADQKTRHNTRREKKDSNALAQSILDYASEYELIPKQREEKVLTTASRYLGNPYFRKTIGIVSSRSESEVIINVPYNEFDVAIKRFCDDLIDPESSVTSRTTKEDWETYAKKLMSDGYAPKTLEHEKRLSDKKATKTSTSISTNQTKGTQDNNQQTKDLEKEGKEQPKYTKHPDKRKSIIPQDFSVAIRNKTLRRIFGELKDIDVDDHTLAVSMLSRAFLENVYSLFHEKVAGNYVQMQTHALMDKVINLIKADNALIKREKDALAALRRVQSNENNVLSPKTLGANAHASTYPIASELKREWDNISAILEYMLKRI